MLWPSQVLVRCELRFWGPPSWGKSFRGPVNALGEAIPCSTSLFGIFGMSPHPKLCPFCIVGPTLTLWCSQMLACCEFWFWVPSSWGKSFRDSVNALGEAIPCSTRLFSIFGLSPHPKLCPCIVGPTVTLIYHTFHGSEKAWMLFYIHHIIVFCHVIHDSHLRHVSI